MIACIYVKIKELHMRENHDICFFLEAGLIHFSCVKLDSFAQPLHISLTAPLWSLKGGSSPDPHRKDAVVVHHTLSVLWLWWIGDFFDF